jgi:type-F conjugative transfer system secretin TraK
MTFKINKNSGSLRPQRGFVTTWERSKILLIASLCFIGTTGHAAIIKPLDDLKVIEVPISQKDLTRIVVKDDRILTVFGRHGDYVLESDEDQGQVFIRPTPSVGSKAINLTLTTENGHTQDLRLIPKDQPPETLILREEREEAKSSSLQRRALPRMSSEAPLFREEIEDLLQACQEGRIPLGYKEIPLELNTLTSGSYVLTRELRGKTLRGLTYEVHTNSNTPLVMSEAKFAQTCGIPLQDIVAILMPIALQQGTQIHVVARTHS